MQASPRNVVPVRFLDLHKPIHITFSKPILSPGRNKRQCSTHVFSHFMYPINKTQSYHCMVINRKFRTIGPLWTIALLTPMCVACVKE